MDQVGREPSGGVSQTRDPQQMPAFQRAASRVDKALVVRCQGGQGLSSKVCGREWSVRCVAEGCLSGVWLRVVCQVCGREWSVKTTFRVKTLVTGQLCIPRPSDTSPTKAKGPRVKGRSELNPDSA